MAKNSPSKALSRGAKNIEAAVSKRARLGKDKVAAKLIAVASTIGVGTALGEALSAMYKGDTKARDIIKRFATLSEADQDQAIKEFRIHQYKAQCDVVGKAYVKDMAPADFMHKKGTIGHKKQRSIAANYSRTMRVLLAIRDKYNVTKILEQSNIALMAAYANKGGSSGENKTALKGSGFDSWLAKLDRVCMDRTDETQVAHLEKLLIKAMKLAEKHASAISEPVLKMVGVELNKAQKKAA